MLCKMQVKTAKRNVKCPRVTLYPSYEPKLLHKGASQAKYQVTQMYHEAKSHTLRSLAFDVRLETDSRCHCPAKHGWPADQPESASSAPPTQLTTAHLHIPLQSSLSDLSISKYKRRSRVKMVPLQTKLSSFITSLSIDKPPLYRSDSASSFGSAASSNRMEGETELQPWKYGHKRAYSEQDEVKRKRVELAEKKRRASDAAWREFWP